MLWLINIVPSLAGFSLKKERITIFTPFWIIHLSLLFYVYGVGNLVYQKYYAQEAGDFIKSFVNVSLLVLIANNSYWFLTQRPLLQEIIKEVKQSDSMARDSPEFHKKHEKLMATVYRIVLIFYAVNYGNASCIYLPHRSDVDNEFSMTPCVGIRPLSAFPKRQICSIILCLQELSIMTVVLNYQALLLLFVDHTSAMYKLLSDEMITFNQPDVDDDYVKRKLPSLLQRHILCLSIVNKFKLLFSMPIGINFLSNAACISLFFYLPLPEWLGFIPILVYCFLVFFLYCFLGQRLIDSAEAFERAVYGCGWEKFDVKIQKTIYLMLMNAQAKIEILAADIIPVNIYTFATTIQFMFKFVTVMKF
ncbi:7tm odorant receptor domain-containing protein [Phthorimaea operculella]|nr:7tm odorant receptor domain-containing protein [Phthorimaea operculella]